MSSFALSSLLHIDLPTLLVMLVGTAGVALNILMPPSEDALAASDRCC